ncbi:hypothetical protein DIPPA_04051 [Diplonema papillatum]|nr:hypothetical protein DIPPA_04051 [Diplonema papillatum]
MKVPRSFSVADSDELLPLSTVSTVGSVLNVMMSTAPEISDVDSHFASLGLQRSALKIASRADRKPASERGPLTPLVLDKVQQRAARKSSRGSEAKMVAELLEIVAAANGQIVPAGQLAGLRADFECVTAPSMSITAYINQLSHLGFDSVWPAVVSMIDRIGRSADTAFTPYTAHRLVVTAYSLASKEVLLRETEHDARMMSRVAGVSVADLHKMETSFLQLLSEGAGAGLSRSEHSWDAIVGLQDAPAIRGALPKILRTALRDHALRSVSPPTPNSPPVAILPEYLDSTSSSSCTSTPVSLSTPSFSRRLTDAKQYALSQSSDEQL